MKTTSKKPKVVRGPPRRPIRRRRRLKPTSKKSKVVLEGQWLLPLGIPPVHLKRAEYRRCGDPTCHTCREGQGHGPYLYAVWREGKKVKRKYLGKA